MRTLSNKSDTPQSKPPQIVIGKEAALIAKKQLLKQQMDAIEQQEADQKAALAAQAAEDLQERKEEAEEYLNKAEQLEKMSHESPLPFDKKTYALDALELRKKAAEVYPEGNAPVQEAETVDYKGAWKQVGSLGGIIALSLAGFAILMGWINKHNATLEQGESAMAPYGWDSFQKLFYENFVTGLDLFVLLGVLFIICPQVVRYILPFVKGEKSSVNDFNNLNAWQRQIISFGYVAAFVLYLALRHSVKP